MAVGISSANRSKVSSSNVSGTGKAAPAAPSTGQAKASGGSAPDRMVKARAGAAQGASAGTDVRTAEYWGNFFFPDNPRGAELEKKQRLSGLDASEKAELKQLWDLKSKTPNREWISQDAKLLHGDNPRMQELHVKKELGTATLAERAELKAYDQEKSARYESQILYPESKRNQELYVKVKLGTATSVERLELDLYKTAYEQVRREPEPGRLPETAVVQDRAVKAAARQAVLELEGVRQAVTYFGR